MSRSFIKLFVPVILLPLIARSQEPKPVIPLWPNGAPGFEAKRNEPEHAESYWVANIHNPSMTVFLAPKEKATGAAVVICPGGGHRKLVYKPEGVEPAEYLNNIGVAAFVLKYRLAREEGSPYKIERHAREDGQRAMRLVRSRANEWGIDPHKVGLMGFSAGGEVLALVIYNPSEGNPNADDPVDRVDCRPDFQIVIYPGPLGFPATVPSNTPPALFITAFDDDSHTSVITKLLPEFSRSKVPYEAHILARGGHGFNMGGRSKFAAVKTWPQRMTDWLEDNGMLQR